MNFRTKLIIGCVGVYVVILSFCISNLIHNRDVLKNMNDVSERYTTSVSVLLNIQRVLNQSNEYAHSYRLVQDPAFKSEFYTSMEDLDLLIGSIHNGPVASANTDETTTNTLLEEKNELFQSYSLLFEAIESGNTHTATIENRIMAQEDQLQQMIIRLMQNEQTNIISTNHQTAKNINQNNIIIIGFMITTFGLLGAFGYITIHSFSKSLRIAKTVTDQIIRGNFMQQIPHIPKDEIGALTISLTSVTDKLREAYTTLGKNNTEFMQRYSQLDSTKRAMMNILDDLETEKMLLSQEKLKDEAILGSIGEGMIATDEEKRIIIMNTAAETMLGYSLLGVQNKKIFEVLTIEDDKDNVLLPENLPISQALSKGEKIFAVNTFVRKDKSKFPAAVTASPIILHEKRVGAILVFRDITKEAQVDRMKTEFISLASHQLRTPLSAIKWFTGMLLKGDIGEITPEQKEIVDNVYQSNERMITLVNSLLNISRIESGRIIIDPEPTDLKQLIDQVITEVKLRADEKKQTLIVSVNDSIPKINIDPRLVSQIYLNLLTNAIKYTPDGGQISVFVSKNDDMVISQISDNGYGIPQKEHDRLFQKFYRGENIVKVETDGNGLGLYLVKAIVDSSHGKIWFKSEEGHGTTFWFSLPLSGMDEKKGEVTLDS